MNLRQLVLAGTMGIGPMLWLSCGSPKLAQPPAEKQTAGKERKETAAAPHVEKPEEARFPPASLTPAERESAIRSAQLKKLLDFYSAPISFYGKVVDENGLPIGGARIKLVVADKPLTDGTDHERLSHSNGLFELTTTGADVGVWVSKEGYYSTAESKGYFEYGFGYRQTNPTPDKPAMFVLRKMGETEKLVHLSKSIRVLKDGTPVEVDLITGQIVLTGKGHIRLEAWTANHGLDPNKNESYNWKARVSIPGGGWVERTGEYDFQAPDSGYTAKIEAGMTKDATRWSESFQRHFFAKLENGSFARLKIELKTGGDHFYILESFTNPMPGSRNLEFDPKNAVEIGRR